MTKALRKKMGEAAIKAAASVNYEGVGTVEFLVDKDRNFYFMEMNTRIQVEHTITEEVIDYDLIREQIKIAAGIPISGLNYEPTRHSIQCRINAEDPFNDFRPTPGKITSYHSPGGHGVRVDTHVYAGYTIPPNYDSMIGKLIVSAQTREEAHHQDGTRTERVRDRRRAHHDPLPPAADAERAVPQGQFHHEVPGGFRDQEGLNLRVPRRLPW